MGFIASGGRIIAIDALADLIRLRGLDLASWAGCEGLTDPLRKDTLR